jgi:hypothetical protein
MNLETNNSKRQTGISPGRCLWATAALLCSGATLATALWSARAQTVSGRVVQGDLINPPPQTNAAPAGPSGTTSPPAPPAVDQATSQPKPEGGDDYLQVGFDRLAGFPLRLHWVMVDPVRIKGVQKMMDNIPDNIKELDESKIAVRGFMLPLKLDNGLVTDFFLLRTQARCCYGLPIQMNELLTVHMVKHGVKSIMDQPITIYGRLHIAESHDDAGALTSIYSLDGDKMDGPSAF